MFRLLEIPVSVNASGWRTVHLGTESCELPVVFHARVHMPGIAARHTIDVVVNWAQDDLHLETWHLLLAKVSLKEGLLTNNTSFH